MSSTNKFILFSLQSGEVEYWFRNHAQADTYILEDRDMEGLKNRKFNCIYSFGSFEVSSLANTLYKDGEPVRTQYLPLQMLLVLLEHAGQMVTKEELRDRLWGTDTFVEVDQNLYVIVSRLREILVDTARQPQFIQTVPGRGYRFIGTVTQRESLAAPVAPDFDQGMESVGLKSPHPPSENPTEEEQGVNSTGRRRSLTRLAMTRSAMIGSAIALVVLGIAGSFMVRERRQIVYKPHQQILVGGFLNETAKPDLNQTLAFAVQLKFQESPSFDMIPAERLRRRISNPNNAGRDEQLHACSLLGGQLLLNGRLRPLRQGYEIQIMVSRCSDGQLLATESAQADSDASILSAVDMVTDKTRKRLGESESSLQRFDMPLTQATTKSLAALEAFTQGEDKLKAGMALGAVPSYQLAIDLDPQFALAYARIGTIYLNAQEQGIGARYYEKAFQLRDRTTDRERLYIAAHYYTDVTGEYQRAIETYQLWRNLYPNDWGAANNLANLYDLLGMPQDGLRYANQTIQLNPPAALGNSTLAQAYLENSEYASLAGLCGKPAGMNNPLVAFHNICFLGAFAQNNQQAMDQEIKWSRGNPQESTLLESLALAAIFHGQIKAARDLFSQARDNARQNNLPEMIAIADVDQSNAEGEFGFSSSAREIAKDAIRNTPQGQDKTQDVDVVAGTALTLALTGSAEQALRLADQASKQAPLNTILNNLEVPTVRAVLAVKQQNPRAAIDALNAATPLEFCAQTRFEPIYYRGMAYMQLKQWKDSESQFNQLLEHQAIAPNSFYIGLAQMQLGRALQLDGKPIEAKKAYDAAAVIWKDADHDFAPAGQLADYQRSLRQ